MQRRVWAPQGQTEQTKDFTLQEVWAPQGQHNGHIKFKTIEGVVKSLWKQQQQPYTLTPEQQQQQLIAEEVMDFEFEKYKCRFFSNWLELSKVFIGSVLPNSSDKKEAASDWLLGLIVRFVLVGNAPIGQFELLLWIQNFLAGKFECWREDYLGHFRSLPVMQLLVTSGDVTSGDVTAPRPCSPQMINGWCFYTTSTFLFIWKDWVWSH